MSGGSRAAQLALPHWKHLASEWLPPLLVRWFNARVRRQTIRYAGDYRAWEDARRDSNGYDAAFILERVAEALGKVRDGKAAAERDSVVLDRIEYPFPLLAGLLRAACRNGNRLHVLDIGGSLGSTYFLCRRFLNAVAEVRWSIIEQAAFVARGRASFQTDEVRFYIDLNEFLAEQAPHVLLLSSVLSYLPSPHCFLDEVLTHPFSDVIIDRTGVFEIARDRLTVQHVPASIYGWPVSYPAWIFNRARLLEHLSRRYEVDTEFPTPDGLAEADGTPVLYCGFLLSQRA